MSLHEHYVQYLDGCDDKADEERLRQSYEERIACMREEIQRLRDQQVAMDMRLADYRSEHDRLVELQKEPQQLETEVDSLRAALQSQEAHVQRIEADITQAEDQEQELLVQLEEVQNTLRQLSDQVEAQAYSKNDIERLKSKRGHLQQVLKNLRADLEKAEQDVWDLSTQESSQSDVIARRVRQVNEMVESLDSSLAVENGTTSQAFLLQVDLEETTETIASISFDSLHKSAQKASAVHMEIAQREDAHLHEILEEQRVVQADLTDKERERDRLGARVEQLHRTLEEYNVWSAQELDDAQRATVAAEDSVRAASIGSSAPSLRELGEIDQLRLELSALRASGEQQKHQAREQIRREKERFNNKKIQVMKELEAYVAETEKMYEEVSAAMDCSSLEELGKNARHGGG